jgi:3-oxosteroid 1-dehydrogenase
MVWIADQDHTDCSGIGMLATITKTPDWLHRADTLPQLAEQLGLPGDSLVETVDRFNKFAREGRDPDFNRGESTYQLYWGNRLYAGRKPNPTLGPLEKPPFYGVELRAGSVGNLGGLVVNSNAQVVNVHGEVIPGLYGTSNASALLSHGFTYTSGSCQGKSLIFGYLAARHMAKNQ